MSNSHSSLIDIPTTNYDSSLDPVPPIDKLFKAASDAAGVFPNHDDLAERRRIQNRIAQRNYRKILKRRLELLEQTADAKNSDHVAGLQEIKSIAESASETVVDPEVFAYQGEEEPIAIQCTCGLTNDRRFIIPCITCGTWQHITCYYELVEDVVDQHECFQCSPRELTSGDDSSPKRPASPCWKEDVSSSTTRSNNHPRTVGAKSSVAYRLSGAKQSSNATDFSSFMGHSRVGSVESDNSIPKRDRQINAPRARSGRKRLPASAPGPPVQFVVANHPADFKSDKVLRTVRQHAGRTAYRYTDGDEANTEASLRTDGKKSFPGDIKTNNRQLEKGSNDWAAIQTKTSNVVPKKASSRHLEEEVPEADLLQSFGYALGAGSEAVQTLLPESWRYDVEYQTDSWTCTPLGHDIPKYIPLRIVSAPIILPVAHRWPPVGGANPPPDPWPSAPIDRKSDIGLDVVRDLFLTFEGSIGLYILINGLLQIIVREEFDTAWALSHLPHKYGGLKVSYIPQTVEATMLPSTIETTKTKPSFVSQTSGLSSMFHSSRQSTSSSSPSLKLNDFIEARPKAILRKEKYSGRVGLKVIKANIPYLLMSTHIVTEAILEKSHRDAIFGRGRDRSAKLDGDWNEHVEIWAGNEAIGTSEKSFDTNTEIYPNGFFHDVTLIRPATASSIKDIACPVDDLGWLNRDSWTSLRQQTSAVRILGTMEEQRSAKSIRCNRPSEIMVVGEGIFLNQTAAAGNSKSLRDHDMSTWKTLVSRAVLYRVYPDFDPPNGYSGVALFADGIREDGTPGQGIVGSQSFVQRSVHVQDYGMESPALDKRLQLGRVAFYGAFEVPEELRRDYTIV